MELAEALNTIEPVLLDATLVTVTNPEVLTLDATRVLFDVKN